MSTAVNPKRIGFCGLGIMGDGMARCLLKDEAVSLSVWNRSKGKVEALEAEYPGRIHACESPAKVVQAADLTVMMLSTPEACTAVYEAEDGVLAGVTSGKMIVDCATLRPQDMIARSAQVEEKGGKFLEAPVSGSKGPAATGALIFLCGGDADVLSASSPYLDLMGKATHMLGAIGEGTKMKLVVNGLMANLLASLGESIHIAEAAGLSSDKLLEVVGQGVMASPMFGLKGPNMIKKGSDAYPANFPLKHALKDLNFSINDLPGATGSSPFAIARASRTYYEKALEEGMGDLDFAAVADVMGK